MSEIDLVSSRAILDPHRVLPLQRRLVVVDRLEIGIGLTRGEAVISQEIGELIITQTVIESNF